MLITVKIKNTYFLLLCKSTLKLQKILRFYTKARMIQLNWLQNKLFFWSKNPPAINNPFSPHLLSSDTGCAKDCELQSILFQLEYLFRFCMHSSGSYIFLMIKKSSSSNLLVQFYSHDFPLRLTIFDTHGTQQHNICF